MLYIRSSKLIYLRMSSLPIEATLVLKACDRRVLRRESMLIVILTWTSTFSEYCHRQRHEMEGKVAWKRADWCSHKSFIHFFFFFLLVARNNFQKSKLNVVTIFVGKFFPWKKLHIELTRDNSYPYSILPDVSVRVWNMQFVWSILHVHYNSHIYICPYSLHSGGISQILLVNLLAY